MKKKPSALSGISFALLVASKPGPEGCRASCSLYWYMGHRWPEPHAFLEDHQSGSLGFSSSCYSTFRIHFSIISCEPLCPPSLLGLISLPFISGRSSRSSLTLNILSWLPFKTASWYQFWPFQIPSEQELEKKAYLFFLPTISHSDDSKCRILYCNFKHWYFNKLKKFEVWNFFTISYKRCYHYLTYMYIYVPFSSIC